MKQFICQKRNKTINTNIRGTFLVDNSGNLRTKIPRKDNLKFISTYLYNNPCAKSSDVRRALLQWRGIRVNDESRGQYASYFYDRYCGVWYYNKLWQKIKPLKGLQGIRLNLTLEGMTYVDFQLSEKLKSFDFKKNRVMLFIESLEDIEKLEGFKYLNIIP